MSDGFEFDQAELEREAEQRWGDTAAFRESRRRTSSYGEAQWEQIHTEGEQILAEFANLHRQGADPGGEHARAVAERHRLHISRWFYDLSHEMHVELARMYVTDERFARYYNSRADGLVHTVREAIEANANHPGSAGTNADTYHG